jgi:hypothetical protein
LEPADDCTAPDAEDTRVPVLLVIDGSHVANPYGDVDMLLTQVMPLLPSGSLVHIHDIVLPFNFPSASVGALYSENRHLGALIADSSRYEVVAPLHAASLADAEARLVRAPATDTWRPGTDEDFWRPEDGSPLRNTALEGCPPLGSSFWLRVRP